MQSKADRAYAIAKLMREMRECDLGKHRIYRACSNVLRRAAYGDSRFAESSVAKEIVDALPRVY